MKLLSLLFFVSSASPVLAQAVTAEPPPRLQIDGLGGLLVDSRIDDVINHQAIELQVIHVFADRCRMRRNLVGKPAIRDTEFRLGATVHLLPAGKAKSHQEKATRLDSVLLRMELHRALFLWPAGFTWTEAENGHQKTIVRRASQDATSAAIGSLLAELDDDGRLLHMRAKRADGSEAEAYTILSRSEHEGRLWPQELSLSIGGKQRWTERVVRVMTRIKRSDLAFLPYDRRPAPAPGIQAMDLQSFTFRRFDLPAQCTWAAAGERYSELLAELGRELQPTGAKLDPTPTFEVNGTGTPIACLLRLTSTRATAPEGWTTRPERGGLAIRQLKNLSEVTARRLVGLKRAIPKGSLGGRPYVRQLSYRGLEYVDLYLPLTLR